MAPAAPNESLPGEPTNIERRQNADNDTANRNTNPGERRASNLKAYHEGQIAELQKEIDKHQAIVDQQDAILSGDVAEPLTVGTDIAAKFRQANGDGERSPASANDLRRAREEARGKREGNGSTGDESSDNSTDISSESTDTSDLTTPTSTPAEPVSDDAPDKDEAKLDDATTPEENTPDATTPTPKQPTPPSPRKK